MSHISWIDQNAGFLHAMANCLGVSLESALDHNSPVDHLDYRKAVLACAGCMNKDLCITLANTNGVISKCPVFCRNSALLDTLANQDHRPVQFMAFSE